ncbi:MAG: hypothetical protein KAT71_04430 [Gammaproteobacteria bacterium]|nr:hypothetical protein [Gammaproteobacteria bacterium]
MIIEQIFPTVVGEKSNLQQCIREEIKLQNLSDKLAKTIIDFIPSELISISAFFDKMTRLWRYEYGNHYDIKNQYVWGTDTCPPVRNLVNALLCAHSKLSPNKRSDYINRLTNPDKHLDALCEMIPGYKVNNLTTLVDFEVSRLGVGNKTVDWVIYNNDRILLLDVKRRTKDLIEQMEQIGNEPIAPEPNHDVSLLFRSVEDKFISSDSNQQLQGVWIVPSLKQNEQKLLSAFSSLDPNKVHFAILGDWRADAYILVRQPKDEQYLRNIFNLEKSERFTFQS